MMEEKMKNYKIAAAVVLSAVLTVTMSGSSLLSNEVFGAEESIQQDGFMSAGDMIPDSETETDIIQNEIIPDAGTEENVIQDEAIPNDKTEDAAWEAEILDKENQHEAEEFTSDLEASSNEMETDEEIEANSEASLREGICNEEGTVTWKIEDGKMVIEGNGRMTDWNEPEEVPWHSLRNEIKAVDVREGIENVGSYAFANCEALTDIQMAGSVHEIGSYSFYGSTGSEELEIG